MDEFRTKLWKSLQFASSAYFARIFGPHVCPEIRTQLPQLEEIEVMCILGRKVTSAFTAMALGAPSLHFSCLAPRLTTALVLSSRLSRGLARQQKVFITPALVGGGSSGRRRSFSARAQRDEEAAAKAAALNVDAGAPTIFDKIVKREIPATVVYENVKVLAFRDINPQAPVHVVLIPKERDGLTQLSKASERNKDVLGELLFAAKVVAEQEGLVEGFRVVINDGPQGCQSVYHLHLHLLGGRQLKWPPG